MNLAEFKKDYPCLSNMVKHWMNTEKGIELVSAGEAMERHPQPVLFHPRDIQEHCQDNQRLKEAITKIKDILNGSDGLDMLEEELGLEND